MRARKRGSNLVFCLSGVLRGTLRQRRANAKRQRANQKERFTCPQNLNRLP